MACHILPIFPGSSQAHSPMEPSWTRLSSCWVLFTSLISHEGPVLFCSIICTHAHGFSQLLGVRSVHQALFWNLMLIISNPHSKLQSKCWPHFTDEETEKLWPHHWSEGGQLLNRRAGIWMSSCQFRVFCSFTSCCPGGDWRYVWNEDNT